MSEQNKPWPEVADLEWSRNETDAKYGPSTSRRNEPRVMVRFECTSSNGVAMPGTNRATFGTNHKLVYRNELAKFRAEFPTDEERADMKRAREEYDGLVQARIAKLTRLTSGPEYEAKKLEAEATIGANPFGIYHSLRNRRYGDRSPVRSYPAVDGLVVRDGFEAPAPETTASAAQNAQASMTEAFTAALREVFGPAMEKFAGASKAR